MVSPTGLSVTVASAASASGMFSPPGGTQVVAICTPGTLDGTTDGIAFKVWSGVKSAAGTYASLYTSGGTLITVTSTSALWPHAVTLTKNIRDSLKGFAQIKLVMMDSAAADAQTGARVFVVRTARI